MQDLKKVIWLTHIDERDDKMNMPYGNLKKYDTTIYRGLDNDIHFIIRNVDRKPINLLGRSFIFTVINEQNEELMLEKEAEILDPHKGRLKVDILQGDTFKWIKGWYRYVLTMVDKDDKRKPLYFDESYNIRGYIRFDDTSVPKPVESIEVTEFHPKQNEHETETWYVSSSIKGPSYFGYKNKTTTFAFYFTNFKGVIRAQGSIEDVPSNDKTWGSSWFDISLDGDTEYHLDYFTGIKYFNVTSNIVWFRYIYIEDVDNQGSVDKILVKVK